MLAQIEARLDKIEKKVDHLTGLVEEALAYLDGMEEDRAAEEDDWEGEGRRDEWAR